MPYTISIPPHNNKLSSNINAMQLMAALLLLFLCKVKHSGLESLVTVDWDIQYNIYFLGYDRSYFSKPFKFQPSPTNPLQLVCECKNIATLMP